MNGLVPVVVQDAVTSKVLMVGFMNEEAYEKTRQDRRVTFYSRTRKRLWTKGEESGNYLNVRDIMEDCDNDTLLIKVVPEGPVCHTGADTCFSEVNKAGIDFLDQLQNIIKARKSEMPEGSYTSELFKSGINRIAQKVGEEAVELIIESKDNNRELLLNESADLLYHLLVLFTQKGYELSDVVKILENRHK